MIERKAVDLSGRLGSLYDASTDNLIHQHSIQEYETIVLNEALDCKIWPGNISTNVIMDCLKRMNFDDAVQLSILLGMVKPTGVSSLVNYSQPINENTRFFYCSYRNKEEKLDIKNRTANQTVAVPSASKDGTHMITDILWGFEIFCIIQIPYHESANTVDCLLERISDGLKSKESDFNLSDADKQQIKRLTNVTVYHSETPIDKSNTSLLTALTNLNDWKRNENFHHPLILKMCSLRKLFNNDRFPDYFDFSVQTYPNLAEILSIITWLDSWARYFQGQSKRLPQNFPSSTLEQMLKDVQQRSHGWLTTYEEFRTHLQNALINVRRRCCESTVMQDIISNQQNSLLKETKVTTFAKTIKQLLTKRILIKRLDEDQIQYINVMDLRYHKRIPVTHQEIKRALRRSLLKDDSRVIVMYSTDRFRDEQAVEWKQVYQDFILKRQKREERTTLVYVDFTECKCDLEDLIIKHLLLEKSSKSPPEVRSELGTPRSSTNGPPLDRPPKQPPPTPETEINVLLLGETGVGKSTFINAFVNYLLFDTLQQAERSEPVVLIPVSFLTTIGDQFEEFIVKFGDPDSNENHEHQGQSVTQHCKSYVFHLTDTIRLRLIDSPGMGDTRGVAQDEKNINHILTYVNNLSHLNAICLLFKPNASRLNIFFRSCLNQLLTYLTPIGYNNLIFCFTNARSTFFAPGDTGPLLRQMLKQEHHDGIPFEKQNTFCFDSESFRYLAARKRDVKFDEFQTQECIKSWTTSVTESIRLLNSIRTREPYYVDDWQSSRKIAIEISMLARPLMETLRLILYNWKLYDAGLIDNQFILNTDVISTEICSNCAQSKLINMGSFYIVEYGSVKSKAAQNCLCSYDERHFLIESTVKYDFVSQPVDRSSDVLKSSFHNLLFKCDQLTHFLQQKNLSSQDDPFTSVFHRFLDEEQYISDTTGLRNGINKEVHEILSSIRKIRQQNSKKLNDSNETLSLNQVCQILDQLKSIHDVNKQIECIKTSRRLKMEANEHHVTIPPIKNKILATCTKSLH